MKAENRKINMFWNAIKKRAKTRIRIIKRGKMQAGML